MSARPIRVLHVLQRFEAAGVQTLLLGLNSKINPDEVHFDYLVHYEAPQELDEAVEELGGTIYRSSVREDYDFVKYWRYLNRLFEREKFDIVHGHMHSLGAIYLRNAAMHGVAVRIAHSHTNSTQRDWKRSLKLFMNSQYAKNATDLLACSEEAGNYMFGDRPFKVLHNSIDVASFRYNECDRTSVREELGIGRDDFLVGNVGRFEIQKNQLFLLKVFSRLLTLKPDARLLLVGTGSMLEEVKSMASDAGLSERVLFLGTRSDVPRILHALDVFVLPSLFEGLGIVAVESQAAGIPTVITDCLPSELDLTHLVSRVSLSASPDEWASEILEAGSCRDAKTDTTSLIELGGYDSRGNARWLVDYYKSLLGWD